MARKWVLRGLVGILSLGFVGVVWWRCASRAPYTAGKQFVPAAPSGTADLKAVSLSGTCDPNHVSGIVIHGVRKALRLEERDTSYSVGVVFTRSEGDVLFDVFGGYGSVTATLGSRTLHSIISPPPWNEPHIEPTAHAEYNLADDFIVLAVNEDGRNQLQFRVGTRVVRSTPWRGDEIVCIQWSTPTYPLAFA